MTVIQGGRWESFTRRLFSLKGMQEPQSVSPELIPTVSVIPERPEDAILRADKLFHGTRIAAGGVGSYGFVAMHNTSLNQIVVIERAWIIATLTVKTFTVAMGNNVTGTGNITVSGRDTRLGLTLLGGKQAGQLYFGNEVAIGGTKVQLLSGQADQQVEIACPIVLAPGHKVMLWMDVTNNAADTTWLWREREAEPGELTL